MRVFIRTILTSTWSFFAILILVKWSHAPSAHATKGEVSTTPLPHAHSHNDYEHPRPLLDALKHGFCSVEVDVWILKDLIFVGHYPWDIHPNNTLEKLYLEPLRSIVKDNGGQVYKAGPQFYLLIDVKTPAKYSYEALNAVLARYSDILSVVNDGTPEAKAVSVVITGNRAVEVITQQKVRYVGFDGRIGDLESTKPSHLMPWISADWFSCFSWNGQGIMPEKERSLLRDIVSKAHRHNRKVRFWGTPDNPALWKELRTAGVDWISTDALEKLSKWSQIEANKK